MRRWLRSGIGTALGPREAPLRVCRLFTRYNYHCDCFLINTVSQPERCPLLKSHSRLVFTALEILCCCPTFRTVGAAREAALAEER